MNIDRRYLLIGLLAALFLFLGVVFRQFLLVNLILPVATVAWLFLRIFVLSIDQQFYWLVLILLIVFIALIRLFRSVNLREPYLESEIPTNLVRVSYWQSAIRFHPSAGRGRDPLKEELIWMLTSMYSSRRQGSADYEIREAYQQRQIPLPEPVYAFLFAEGPVEPRQNLFKHPIGFFKQILRAIRLAVQKWLRARSGREAADYYQAIAEVLNLMEASLEKKYDEPTDTHDH